MFSNLAIVQLWPQETPLCMPRHMRVETKELRRQHIVIYCVCSLFCIFAWGVAKIRTIDPQGSVMVGWPHRLISHERAGRWQQGWKCFQFCKYYKCFTQNDDSCAKSQLNNYSQTVSSIRDSVFDLHSLWLKGRQSRSCITRGWNMRRLWQRDLKKQITQRHHCLNSSKPIDPPNATVIGLWANWLDLSRRPWGNTWFRWMALSVKELTTLFNAKFFVLSCNVRLRLLGQGGTACTGGLKWYTSFWNTFHCYIRNQKTMSDPHCMAISAPQRHVDGRWWQDPRILIAVHGSLSKDIQGMVLLMAFWFVAACCRTRIILKLDASGTACIMGSKMICFILKQFPSTTQKAEVQFRPHCITKSSPQWHSGQDATWCDDAGSYMHLFKDLKLLVAVVISSSVSCCLKHFETLMSHFKNVEWRWKLCA